MFLKIPGRKTNAFRKMRRKTDFAEIYWETDSNYEYIRWMPKVVIVPCLHSSLLNWGGSSRLKSPGHHLHTNRKPCQNTDKAFFLLAWMTIWMPLRPTIISTIQTPSLPSFKGFFFFLWKLRGYSALCMVCSGNSYTVCLWWFEISPTYRREGGLPGLPKMLGLFLPRL